MKYKYISVTDAPLVKIVKGRWYKIVDWRSQPLPSLTVTPLRKRSGEWECQSNLGGILHIKAGQFVEAV